MRAVRVLDVFQLKILPIFRIRQAVAEGVRLIPVPYLRKGNIYGAVRSRLRIDLSAGRIAAAVGNAHLTHFVRLRVDEGETEILFGNSPDRVVADKFETHIA